MKRKLQTILIILALSTFWAKLLAGDAPKPQLPGGDNKWQLTWNDEFSYPNSYLDGYWTSANDSTQSNILCARIRRNAVVSNGTLKLQNKKETVGTKVWTSGSVWTKQRFMYGYYECRYKYAAATGTNNSFWLIQQNVPTLGKKYEIDINEGHYSAQMATNIHNWTDITTNPTTGVQTHPSSSVVYNFSNVNLGTEYHYYGLKWTADSLCFFFDGKQVRAVHNDFCYSDAPIYLSEAIITWAGAVTDAINGTQMEIDYVRVYKPIDPNVANDLITNGGFETLISTQPAPWELNREDATTSSFAYVTADPAVGIRSFRVKNTVNLPNTFSTNIAQKLPLTSDGLYEIRLKARTTVSNVGANQISMKLKDEFTGVTSMLNGDSTIEFIPTSTWQSYKFRLNLKENYNNKFYIGVSKYGNYDLDSISVVRVGNVISAIPSVPVNNEVSVTALHQTIRVQSATEQHIDVFGVDGKCICSSELAEGDNEVKMAANGVFIVRLRNKQGTVSKKIILH